jgi:hypothetical protein
VSAGHLLVAVDGQTAGVANVRTYKQGGGEKKGVGHAPNLTVGFTAKAPKASVSPMPPRTKLNSLFIITRLHI